jgi:hypothetical protein
MERDQRQPALSPKPRVEECELKACRQRSRQFNNIHQVGSHERCPLCQDSSESEQEADLLHEVPQIELPSHVRGEIRNAVGRLHSRNHARNQVNVSLPSCCCASHCL